MRRAWIAFVPAVLVIGLAWSQNEQLAVTTEEQLAMHRNLGKAFYENPTTQQLAVSEFQKALALAPD